MVINNKKMLIKKLVGVNSSKYSYYLALEKKIDRITKKNIRLEIVNQLALSTGSSKPFPRIVKNMIPKLRTLVFFQSLTFYLIWKNGLIKGILFYGHKSRCNPCLADQVQQYKKTVYLQSRTRYNRVLDIFAYPAYTAGEPYQVAYYAKDVTRFVDAAKFTSLGEMSAGIANELNSPLTAIVGNSQLLLRETPSFSPHFQLVKDIKSCGARCQRIIQNLLALSRQDEISFEEIDLKKVVEKSFFLVSNQMEKNKIKLINKVSPFPQRIMGNNQGLEQIIINLLLNARDAIVKKNAAGINRAPGKGRITISTRMLLEKFIAVDIADNGCGIKAENIPQVFNPFYTTKKPGKGTGLGLSVSLEIAQAHGGFIDVESMPGKGSTFSLVLPFQQAEGMNNEETAAEGSI